RGWAPLCWVPAALRASWAPPRLRRGWAPLRWAPPPLRGGWAPRRLRRRWRWARGRPGFVPGAQRRCPAAAKPPRRLPPSRLHLLPFLQQDLPLQRADTVDEQDAVQVIHLVLEHTREQALRLDATGDAVTVQALDDDARRTLDDVLQSRDAEAALFIARELVSTLDDL